MAKGMKENIYRYTLSATGEKAGLTVCSPDASLACRASKRGDGQLMLYINNRWDYPEMLGQLLQDVGGGALLWRDEDTVLIWIQARITRTQ